MSKAVGSREKRQKRTTVLFPLSAKDLSGCLSMSYVKVPESINWIQARFPILETSVAETKSVLERNERRDEECNG